VLKKDRGPYGCYYYVLCPILEFEKYRPFRPNIKFRHYGRKQATQI